MAGRRAYPKEAFNGAQTQKPASAAPFSPASPLNSQTPYQPAGNPFQPSPVQPQSQPTSIGYQPPQPTFVPNNNNTGTPGYQPQPQFYNPNTLAPSVATSQQVPQNLPAFTNYATTTTVSAVPELEPLPMATSFQPPVQPVPTSMPPPVATQVKPNTYNGPKHAPPPTMGAAPPPAAVTNASAATPSFPDHQSSLPGAQTQPASLVHRKRPVMMQENFPSVASPTLAEFGGHMPQQQARSPLMQPVNMAGASPIPDAKWAPDPRFVQCTLESWPNSNELLDKIGLPFGITFHPLAETGTPVPVVNFGETNIVRCKRCRGYINPYVSFVEGGKRWKCNLCYFLNDVPREYFSVVGNDGLRYDQAQRVELNHSVVEFVASPEFMHRPPQPPIYYFVIDVSYTAIVSGMVRAACNSIKHAIDQKLSQNERTKVGFITFDSTVHFYNLRSSLSSPQMLVVPEIDQPFAPHADDLLVNLKDSKHLVDKLLSSLLPSLFLQGQANESALGPALHCAHSVMASQGGKLVVFQTVLPSLGVGKLPDRQATVTEANRKQLLQPGEQFYKNLALEFSKSQIGCDLFLLTPKYIDVATISCLAKFTGGEVFHYMLDSFAAHEVSRLQNDIYCVLTRNTGFEALMRVRCSKGLSIENHHGSFFLRAQDLLNLPNVDTDKSYTLKMKVTDSRNFVTAKNVARDGRYYASIQAGLLYTTSSGERRIRIVTKCCPITEQVADLYRDVNERACVSLIGKLAITKALEEGIPKAVQAVRSACSHTLAQYAKNAPAGSGRSDILLPNTLLHFPLYCLSIIKNSMFRADTSVDERLASMLRFETLSVEESLLWLHPTLFNLTNFQSPESVLPPALELSAEKLDQRGIFLLDNGVYFLLWVGSQTDPAVLRDLFGISSLAEVDASNSQLQIPRLENELSQRVNKVLDTLRAGRTSYTWLYPMKEKDPTERRFFSKLVYDRFPDSGSYHEFITELKTFVSQRQTGR